MDGPAGTTPMSSSGNPLKYVLIIVTILLAVAACGDGGGETRRRREDGYGERGQRETRMRALRRGAQKTMRSS